MCRNKHRNNSGISHKNKVKAGHIPSVAIVIHIEDVIAEFRLSNKIDELTKTTSDECALTNTAALTLRPPIAHLTLSPY